MRNHALRFALSIARAWVVLYTLGASPDARARRRSEIASDLWESIHTAEPVGSLQVLRRVGGGALDDLEWAIATRGINERIATVTTTIRRIGRVRLIATITLGCVFIALAASMIGGADAATTMVLGALGIVGFTGLALSVTDSSCAHGTTTGGDIMNAQFAAIRQKRLLTVLVACVVLVAVTAAYAFTRDDWGDTGALVIVGIFPLGAIVGLAALTLLIADLIKASRQR